MNVHEFPLSKIHHDDLSRSLAQHEVDLIWGCKGPPQSSLLLIVQVCMHACANFAA